ncbi:GNAT family N-acetyltransferase [Aphanothece hegewaldii CCALA 016]|uniref:GNAT family N-acetyltransferase n=1 Tax=Aphanothece hegewaldii CCALA 016 TaxID=2107694 RepID=A0A2T1LVC7_9CHRO|nr:GNAT family N-acetyltransferase [Aphanothece hegewaldii]PSF35675.1 GNAT family N-acetyltransferase [Aphanothece hegewaldii CCALA 016]
MSATSEPTIKLSIRPIQYRDLEVIETLVIENKQENPNYLSVVFKNQLQQVRRWFGILKILSLFPNPLRHQFWAYVAEAIDTDTNESSVQGLIQVSPFNSSRSTWRVEQVLVHPQQSLSDPQGVGSQLLRHCFESIWEARTWMIEVNIHQKATLALYRQHGFQPLAEMTYWSLSPQLLEELAQGEPDLPNLLPVSNADAQLLYQLDCVSMPPLLRQVYDRHLQDFKLGLLNSFGRKVQSLYGHTEITRGYVFEPQRKAAIGHFELTLCKDGSRPHQARLTVHPAYTWLYPKLLGQMAQITRKISPQALELISADYQHERQEYLEQLKAERVEHTLLMSRSVWHKLRETKLEKLQFTEVLQNLQAVPRTPIPSRMSVLKWPFNPAQKTPTLEQPTETNSPSDALKNQNNNSSDTSENGHHA